MPTRLARRGVIRVARTDAFDQARIALELDVKGAILLAGPVCANPSGEWRERSIAATLLVTPQSQEP